MPKPKRSHHLRYGEGSFYWDATKKNWRGVLEAGTDENGRRLRFRVQSRDEDTAWNKLLAKKRDLANGKTTLNRTSAITVKDWTTTWLNDRETQVRPKTFTTDSGQINKWITPRFGNTRLEDLTGDHIRALARAMRAAGKSSTTIRYTQRIFQQAMRDAVRDGYTVPTSFLEAKQAKTAANTRDAIELDAAIHLVEIAASYPDGSRWLTALLQGMRQGECLGLTWDAVDLNAGTLEISWQLQALPYADRARGVFRVPDGYEARHLEGAYHLVRPKSKSGYRVIPLIPHMVIALERWREIAPASPYGLVWPGPDGRPRNPNDDREEWQALQVAADVSKSDGSPFVLHEARNTTATLLLAAGVDPEIIKTIMGHSNIVTSRGYMRASQAMKRDALESVGRLLKIDR